MREDEKSCVGWGKKSGLGRKGKVRQSWGEFGDGLSTFIKNKSKLLLSLVVVGCFLTGSWKKAEKAKSQTEAKHPMLSCCL